MLAGVNILIVEDDKLNQKIISYILLKQGATIEMALDGNEAITILSKSKFNIILMDLQMPGMDGYTATSYIRKNMKIDTPVIALTADPFADKTTEYTAAGITACVCKPVDPNTLCTFILDIISSNKN